MFRYLHRVQTQAPHVFAQKSLPQECFLHILVLCRGVLSRLKSRWTNFRKCRVNFFLATGDPKPCSAETLRYSFGVLRCCWLWRGKLPAKRCPHKLSISNLFDRLWRQQPEPMETHHSKYCYISWLLTKSINGQFFFTELALRPPQTFEKISEFRSERFSQRWIPKPQFWYPPLRFGSQQRIPEPLFFLGFLDIQSFGCSFFS